MLLKVRFGVTWLCQPTKECPVVFHVLSTRSQCSEGLSDFDWPPGPTTSDCLTARHLTSVHLPPDLANSHVDTPRLWHPDYCDSSRGHRCPNDSPRLGCATRSPWTSAAVATMETDWSDCRRCCHSCGHGRSATWPGRWLWRTTCPASSRGWQKKSRGTRPGWWPWQWSGRWAWGLAPRTWSPCQSCSCPWGPWRAAWTGASACAPPAPPSRSCCGRRRAFFCNIHVYLIVCVCDNLVMMSFVKFRWLYFGDGSSPFD